MTNKDKRRVPELRFKGFTGDWEQRKLGSITDRVTRKNDALQSDRPLTISAQDGLIDQRDFFDKQVASRDISGYLLVRNGEFAYNKSYSKGYPWGAIKRLDLYSTGVLSTLYIVFSIVGGDSDFLAAYFDSDKWYRGIAAHATEGARNHGLLNISPSEFFKMNIMLPKDNDEQKQIAKYISTINRAVSLHERKLERFRKLKQAYLKKLFV